MNVLHLARTMGQGGAEKIIFQLATGTNTNENKIVIVSCGGVYVNSLERQGIHHYQIQDLECKKPTVIAKTLILLVKIIKKEKIQIIHSHHRMAALYARLLKIIYPKIKLVYTAHNVFYDKKRFTQFALSKTQIVSVGNSVSANLADVFLIDRNRIKTIYNAVSIETKENDHGHKFLNELKSEGNVLVGVIGRLSEQKGIDIFIKAMKLLVDEYSDIKGIIIGDGELKSELQAMVSEFGLADTIHFLGYQSHVLEIIRQVDFVVMPSRWEGFPLTPIEVFAMGKTLVGTDIGGINEIVMHKRNGLLVPADNPELLSAAMKELILNPDTRNLYGKNGRLDYEEKFSYEQFLEDYLLLYKEILGW